VAARVVTTRFFFGALESRIREATAGGKEGGAEGGGSATGNCPVGDPAVSCASTAFAKQAED